MANKETTIQYAGTVNLGGIDLKNKLTGISTPFGGLSWDKSICEKDRIIFLFTYFESKRILFNPAEMENKEWCIKSILEIKGSLVEITKDIKISAKTLDVINNMIDTCNHYLDNVSTYELHGIIYKNGTSNVELSFYRAMNKFRDDMKKAIENFEQMYNIKFRKELPKAW